MENEKQSYFDCIELIEKEFPETTKFDYSKLSTQELEIKIRKLFETIQLNVRSKNYDYSEPSKDITEETIKRLVINYTNMCKENLERRGITNDPTFDQNSAFLKLMSTNLKNDIYKLVKENKYKHGWLSKRSFELGYTRPESFFSGQEQMEKLQDKEKIEKDLRNLLTITKRKKESTEYIGELSLPMARTICYRYGLDESLENEIYDIIGNALRNSYIHEGNLRQGDFGLEYESVSVSQTRLNESIENCIKKITNIISIYVNNGIENSARIQRNINSARAQQNKSVTPDIPNPFTSKTTENEKVTPETTKNEIAEAESSNLETIPGPKEGGTTGIIDRWKKYQELVKKNEELFKLYQELAAKKSEIESMMTDIEKQMQSNMDEMRK